MRDSESLTHRVFELYADSLKRLADEWDASEFTKAVDLIHGCRGMVVVTGMGKAGIISQKISATLASTGTPSIFLHPSEAIHGDLGRVRKNDLVLALSNSGTTDEIIRLVDPLKRIGTPFIAITGIRDSPTAIHADVVLWMGSFQEACPIGLAPTTSTMLMLAIGDLLAIGVMERRNFSSEEFAFYHPGGALGRKLVTVGEVMRQGSENPIVPETRTVAEAMLVMTQTKGRPGAVSIVQEDETLVGVFTDGDLRRRTHEAVVSSDFTLFSRPISEIMTRTPRTMRPHQLAAEALRVLRENRIDQIPVVDEDDRPVGLLDVQDLLDLGVSV